MTRLDANGRKWAVSGALLILLGGFASIVHIEFVSGGTLLLLGLLHLVVAYVPVFIVGNKQETETHSRNPSND